MPSVIDGGDVDVTVLEARGSFAEAEADSEPALTAKRSPNSSSKPKRSSTPSSWPTVRRARRVAGRTRATAKRRRRVRGRAVRAPAFDEDPDERRPPGRARVEAEIDADAVDTTTSILEDAEPEPTDAEPWASALPVAAPGVAQDGGRPDRAAHGDRRCRSRRGRRAGGESCAGAGPGGRAARRGPAPAAAEPRPAPAHKRPEWSELVASLRKGHRASPRRAAAGEAEAEANTVGDGAKPRASGRRGVPSSRSRSRMSGASSIRNSAGSRRCWRSSMRSPRAWRNGQSAARLDTDRALHLRASADHAALSRHRDRRRA